MIDAPKFEAALERLLTKHRAKARSLFADVDHRKRASKPYDRALAELERLIDDSSRQFNARLTVLPEPQFNEALPISERREDIASLITQHQVTIVCGETGSGKTTQIPKIALTLKRGAAGLIGCTQPRRLAARSLARRLKEELPGVSENFVGHKVRFNDTTRDDTVVKVMTDGVLLAEVHDDPLLSAYDVLIIDEAHERSLNIDFLLGIVKRILVKRPDLKVIVTSATIDTERFSQFFNGAPVIEVSGRTYPVEVRYRPEYCFDEETEESDLELGIIRAVQELEREGRGDILVFLPGEREIRDTAEALRKAGVRHFDILPLFSRLSNEDQDRVFKSGGARRIVLATNVAETSLTVPGIHYVIDTGVARVNRYDSRSKVERLHTEPISQASAKQRSGRCGRVAAGIAVRLYAETDFNERPAFTSPEILRTSLAAVILRMLSADLGDPLAFPFIEPPAPKFIDDGYKQLFELGAIDDARHLTKLGRELARLPLDPRVARMLAAARDHHCLTEMLILAAALEADDPRDRPQDKREAADQKQEFFRDEQSDFLTLANIWKWFQEAWDKKGSNREFIAQCREYFLNHLRLREWRDLVNQLTDIVDELKWRKNTQPASYEQVHRALLTGLLGNVGMKALDGDHYHGARGIQFYVSPGSSLKKARPKWVMAAELMETTRLFARTVAKIEPEWIESAAQHLVSRAYFEPRWEKARGEVMAFEQITLYGLTVNPRRRVRYGPIDPMKSREMFIRGALVEGDFDCTLPFFTHNQRLIREVESLEHKARRQDVLVDEDRLAAWFAERVPVGLCDQQSFEAWYREASTADAKLLMLTRDDLMRHGAESITAELYPESITLAGAKLSLKYRFELGHPLDGVTVTVPLHLLNAIEDARVDWSVPGFIREKITAHFKALPKHLRTRLMPAADYVTLFLEEEPFGEGRLADALCHFVRQLTGETISSELLRNVDLLPHLHMNIRVVDDAGKELGSGRNLVELRERLGQAAQLTFAASGDKATGLERQGMTAWDCGDLPEAIAFKRGAQKLTGYPALVDEKDSVAVKVFDSRESAEREHRKGVVRLMAFALKDHVRQLERDLPGFNQAAMQLQAAIPADKLKTDALATICERAFLGDDEAPRSKKGFEDQRGRAKTRLPAVTQGVAKHVQAVAEAYFELNQVIARHASFAKVVAEVKTQRDRLVYPGFLSATEWKRLEHVPRYLRALAYRLGKLREWAERDAKHSAAINDLWQMYDARRERHRKEGTFDANLEEFRWLIEELRVSLFAQELKTPFPVSHKRLMKFWQDNVKP